MPFENNNRPQELKNSLRGAINQLEQSKRDSQEFFGFEEGEVFGFEEEDFSQEEGENAWQEALKMHEELAKKQRKREEKLQKKAENALKRIEEAKVLRYDKINESRFGEEEIDDFLENFALNRNRFLKIGEAREFETDEEYIPVDAQDDWGSQEEYAVVHGAPYFTEQEEEDFVKFFHIATKLRKKDLEKLSDEELLFFDENFDLFSFDAIEENQDLGDESAAKNIKFLEKFQKLRDEKIQEKIAKRQRKFLTRQDSNLSVASIPQTIKRERSEKEDLLGLVLAANSAKNNGGNLEAQNLKELYEKAIFFIAKIEAGSDLEEENDFLPNEEGEKLAQDLRNILPILRRNLPKDIDAKIFRDLFEKVTHKRRLEEGQEDWFLENFDDFFTEIVEERKIQSEKQNFLDLANLAQRARQSLQENGFVDDQFDAHKIEEARLQFENYGKLLRQGLQEEYYAVPRRRGEVETAQEYREAIAKNGFYKIWLDEFLPKDQVEKLIEAFEILGQEDGIEKLANKETKEIVDFEEFIDEVLMSDGRKETRPDFVKLDSYVKILNMANDPENYAEEYLEKSRRYRRISEEKFETPEDHREFIKKLANLQTIGKFELMAQEIMASDFDDDKKISRIVEEAKKYEANKKQSLEEILQGDDRGDFILGILGVAQEICTQKEEKQAEFETKTKERKESAKSNKQYKKPANFDELVKKYLTEPRVFGGFLQRLGFGSLSATEDKLRQGLKDCDFSDFAKAVAEAALKACEGKDFHSKNYEYPNRAANLIAGCLRKAAKKDGVNLDFTKTMEEAAKFLQEKSNDNEFAATVGKMLDLKKDNSRMNLSTQEITELKNARNGKSQALQA